MTFSPDGKTLATASEGENIRLWDVASGGRMGFVTGEDAVENARPASICVQNCQAQNRVRGRLPVLGFPFPVADADKLTPRTSTDGLGAPLTAPFIG